MLAMASVAVACDKENQNSDKPSLKLDPATVEFDAAAGTKTVKVDANQAWAIDGNDYDWVTLSQEEGDGAADVEITVLENTGAAARTANITFRCSIVKKTLKITQAGVGGSVGEGDGTKEKPYSASQANTVASALDADAFSATPVYVEGIVVSFKEPESTVSKYGSLTIYISDDGTTTNQFYVYALKGVNGAAFTSTEPFAVGDKVVVYGYLQNYKGNTPEMTRTSDGVAPQLVTVNGKVPEGTTPDPTPTPSDAIFSETFSASQGEFTIEDKTLPEGAEYVWTWASAQYGMKASAYIGGKNLASESWLISPDIDLTSEKTAFLSFEHAANKFPTSKKVEDFVSVKVSKDGTNWDNLAVPTWPKGNSWNFVASGSVDLKAYLGSKIKIAFVYTSTDGEGGTWEVKNVLVKDEADAVDPEEPLEDGMISLVVDDMTFAETTHDGKKGYTGTSNGVTVTYWLAGGSTDPVAPTDLLKLYKNHKMAIKADGKKIKKVVFTFANASYSKALTIDSDNNAVVNPDGLKLTWSGTASVDEFICTAAAAQVRITKIDVLAE